MGDSRVGGTEHGGAYTYNDETLGLLVGLPVLAWILGRARVMSWRYSGQTNFMIRTTVFCRMYSTA